MQIEFGWRWANAVLLAGLVTAAAGAAEPTRDEVLAAMRSYEGPSADGVDRTTLTGKVVAGYQGWFTAAGDAAGLGWHHYQRRGEFRPGRCSIDLWPDVSELAEDEKFATPFRHADGRVAHVFSSHHRQTVLRHFCWMQEYGIDGVFVQRFVVETATPSHLRHLNSVLAHCREGANQHGRCYALMYDLSGLRAGGIERAIDDWKLLVDRMRLGRDGADHAYLHHRGQPLVAVWGIGFNDGRAYTLAECDRLVEFLKNDAKYGGNAVLVGVPTGWRTLDRDAIADRALYATIQKTDIVSPWTVGRYDSPDEAGQHAERVWKSDIAWCRERGLDYLPVVFPGFSWHNLRRGARLDEIPRRKREFLWRQFAEAKEAGATMIYTAMFDELDEGTAIFKCTSDVPMGASPFVTFEGLPSDHYLRLTGMGGKLLRGELEPTEQPPARSP
ncbi:MAG: glycoside hydrolase family 71/99-like protein [Planctomycetaceae bacterium]|nr:glycoside hydrolase family 71/99-like protein [Planctomycetaceae bacterium]